MEQFNVFGESKKSLALKLYQNLLDEFDIEYQMDCEGFTERFKDILNDYSLVLKSGLIE